MRRTILKGERSMERSIFFTPEDLLVFNDSILGPRAPAFLTDPMERTAVLIACQVLHQDVDVQGCWVPCQSCRCKIENSFSREHFSFELQVEFNTLVTWILKPPNTGVESQPRYQTTRCPQRG